MKPTPQITPSQYARFPLTDYPFRATEEPRSIAAPTIPGTKPLAFYKLSSDFGPEMFRDYLVELFCFTLITGISAWPVISALEAMIRLTRGY